MTFKIKALTGVAVIIKVITEVIVITEVMGVAQTEVMVKAEAMEEVIRIRILIIMKSKIPVVEVVSGVNTVVVPTAVVITVVETLDNL